MLATPHLLAGAAIGSLVGNLPLVIILSIISHYSFDLLPHLDSGTLNLSQKKSYPMIVADLLIGATVLYYLSTIGKLTEATVWWGAVAAISPDLLDNLPVWSDRLHQYWIFNRLHRFHEIIQEPGRRYQFSWGIVTQLLVIGVSLWILVK
jgi:hypothetical protein